MPTSTSRCAVIFNPVKIEPNFRTATEAALTNQGWADTLWLATSEDDAGHQMVTEAVEAGVELVIAAGGDGTVRVVAEGLARTGIPLGIIPSGTANLLAYNLGVPQEQSAALVVAIEGADRQIDLVRMTVDGRDSHHFAVMGGAGLDAMIMDETDPDLKAKLGTAAYFLAAARALGRLPMKARIKIDDHHSRRRKAIIILIGNVSRIRGFTLIPDAKPDDGRLDVMIASPRTMLDWLAVVGRLITRRTRRAHAVETHVARRIEVVLSEPDTYQLDGDVEGEFRSFVAEVDPGALTVRVPA